MEELNDTIAAISTPIGKAGIGIIRLSGPKATAIADKIFSGRNHRRPSSFKTHTVHHGWISVGSGIVDEVLLTVMRAPKTYTKQDIVEINCHSGIAGLRRMLDVVIKNGGRPAEPGEFTRRAFLNGRIDLSQAEAVLDIINSQTEASLSAAIAQLQGGISKKVGKIRDNLLDLAARLEASIDFSCEGIETLTGQEVEKGLKDGQFQIDRLLQDAQAGIVLRDGITAVIWGRPNVGKSSLMNAVLRKERMIVTPFAGTTRDSVEETVDIKGIPVRFVDTAGIAEPEGLAESLAVKKSREYLDQAMLVLLVLDGSEALTKEDLSSAEMIKGRQCVVVINKADLKQNIRIDPINGILGSRVRIISVSALKNTGIGSLENCISALVWSGKTPDPSSIVVTNARHKVALQNARNALEQAREALKSGFSSEFITVDVKDAITALGAITGQTPDDEILDRIFSQFCIGK